MRQHILAFLVRIGSPAIAAAVVLIATLAFHQKSSQAPVWLAPYLSGAANWTPGGDWMVDPASVDKLKAMDANGQWSHRFDPAADRSVLVRFESMDIGWMWVVWTARNLLPFAGDLCAVSLLTLAIHLLLGAAVCRQITAPVTRGLFVILYLANPLVIHVVSMPYYYGWQAVASLVAILLVTSPGARRPGLMVPLLALAFVCVAVRPNAIPLVVIAALWAAYIHRKPFQWLAALLFVASLALVPKVNKPFWHTVYVGLGAYPNRHGLYLSDESAVNAAPSPDGRRMTAEIGGTFHDPLERGAYNERIRDRTLSVVQQDPILPLRNAALNALITFAWVYKPGLPHTIYLLLAGVGAVVLAMHLRHRQHKALLGIALTAGIIIPYYPPIAAYVVGGYAFLALGMTNCLAAMLTSRK